MMSALSPALDPAISSSASGATSPAANDASDAGSGTPFSSVIQGLQPSADAPPADTPVAAGLSATPVTTPVATSAAKAVETAAATPATLPDGPDDLTSALVSVLQVLGLSDGASATASASDTGSADDGGDDPASASDLPQASAAPPLTVAMPLPTSTSAMPSGAPGTGTSVATAATSSDLASDAIGSTGSPAQMQARQWLAAQVPATMTAAAGRDAPAAAPPATIAQQASAASLPLAGSGWLQPPAGFLNANGFIAAGSPGTASGSSDLSAIGDRPATLGDGLLGNGLLSGSDAAKAAPGGLSFAQTLTGAGGSGIATGNGSAPVLATVLPHALQDPSWSDAFSQRVAMLAQQGTQTATLQLNPPELGPIQVRIALGEQGARVEFNTAQQTTSDLITNAMPRLAAALEHQGLRLDDSRVNLVSHRADAFSTPGSFTSARQDTPQGERGQGSSAQAAHSTSGSRHGDADGADSQRVTRQVRLPERAQSGIDYYA